ncbi:MAG: hypothetical protein ACRD8Z_10910 [Nitrososphaeraceae archaeon]|jgi:hypothetical protein
MTAWKEITQKVSDRIEYGITKLLVVRQLRLRQRLIRKSASESKSKSKSMSKKQISPQEAVAVVASIVIIIIAFGGLGLVYSVFP